MKEYALYKGDTLLALGTAKEIAEKMKISIRTVYFYGNPCYLKRRQNNTNYRYLIKLDEDIDYNTDI